jgi:hypothetical protein
MQHNDQISLPTEAVKGLDHYCSTCYNLITNRLQASKCVSHRDFFMVLENLHYTL